MVRPILVEDVKHLFLRDFSALPDIERGGIGHWFAQSAHQDPKARGMLS